MQFGISPNIIFIAFFFLIPVLYWAFNFVVIYHLLRFGVGVQPKKIAAFYLLGSSLLFIACVLALINIDFSVFRNHFAFLESSIFNIPYYPY